MENPFPFFVRAPFACRCLHRFQFFCPPNFAKIRAQVPDTRRTLGGTQIEANMTWKRDRLASLIRSPTTRKDACFVASGRKPKTARVCCTGAVLSSPRRISDLPAKPLNRYPNSQSPTRASVPGQLFRMRSSRWAPRREDAEKLEGIGLARQMRIA